MLQTDSVLPGVLIMQFNSAGLIAQGRCDGAPSSVCTTVSRYAIGCMMTDTTTGLVYINVSTTTTPSWRNAQGSVNQMASPATIATTGNTDVYIIAGESGVIQSIDFSGVDALAANDSNYITFSVTNLGQAGGGSAAVLAATDANTTKATGGTAIAANTKRSLTLSGTAANLVVVAGDRLRLRAAATGTLANTVTFPSYLMRVAATA